VPRLPLGASDSSRPERTGLQSRFLPVQTLLAIAALAAAVVALVPAFFVTWWLAGSDDEPLNWVAPSLGLGVLVGSVAAVVAAARIDPEPSGQAVLVMASPAVLLVLAMPFAGNRTLGRVRLREGLPGLLALSVAPALALAAAALGN
jgi:hypothetical protein